jgi:hypothetical protein
MCWFLLIPSRTVSIPLKRKGLLLTFCPVGIYTDTVLDSYRGKNRLEVSDTSLLAYSGFNIS